MGAAVALATLASTPTPTAQQVLTYMTIAYFFVSSINIGVYLYTPELYPTRVRAIGVGTATAWLRLASIIGPTVVGMMIDSWAGGGVRYICGCRRYRSCDHRPVRR